MITKELLIEEIEAIDDVADLELILQLIQKIKLLQSDTLSAEETAHIQSCLARIAQGDLSAFDDWEMVKK